MRVLLYGNIEPTPATIVSIDVANDLAVLKVDLANLATITFADSSAVRVGDPVVAIGYALDLGGDPSVTSGIISALNRSVASADGTLIGLLQTDAPISSGNSGGPLVNAAGQLIGINTAVANGFSSNTATNIGFAISSNDINRALTRLRANNPTPLKPTYLGILVTVRHDGGRGAVITAVQPGSPAEQLGLQPGDVILAINGLPIDGQPAITAATRENKPGDAITIDYTRDATPRTGQATLTAPPTE